MSESPACVAVHTATFHVHGLPLGEFVHFIVLDDDERHDQELAERKVVEYVRAFLLSAVRPGLASPDTDDEWPA